MAQPGDDGAAGAGGRSPPTPHLASSQLGLPCHPSDLASCLKRADHHRLSREPRTRLANSTEPEFRPLRVGVTQSHPPWAQWESHRRTISVIDTSFPPA